MVDRVLVSQNFISGPKFYCGAWFGFLFARRSEWSARPQFEIGNSTRSVEGCIRRFPVWRPNSSPEAWSWAADVIAYRHPFAQTSISFRSVIEIAYKTPIRNRHSEAPNATLSPQDIRRHFLVKKPSFRTLKLHFQPTITPFPWFSSRTVTLDYANRWRSSHTDSACHGDLKLCSTCRGNSSPRRVGIAYVITIQNRHSETVDRALVSQNFVSGLKFCRGACVLVHRLSYPLGRKRIFVRLTIRTAREAPIKN
ncbi:hypothetical protein Taro_048412 [Colocasia esculenta]|uniref:Uncharacterized protein n=1 Tax=Colocasia esculenta TaxID=4460 RepID=A0A843X871_COLES|nr:hypothetical protein [Colocasia esculenta]